MNHENKGANLFWTFITGVIIGGIAVFLSDEENRETVKRKYREGKHQIEKKTHELQDAAEKKQRELASKTKRTEEPV